MSIDRLTFTPVVTDKDKRRLDFQRSDRSQDRHDSGQENLRTLAGREHAADKLATFVIPKAREAYLADLEDMSPAQLEKAADSILEEADVVDGPSSLESERYAIEVPEDEFTGLEGDETDEMPASPYSDDNSLGQEMSIARQMRGRAGHNGDPELLYQGRGSGIGVEYEPHYTDDEDLSDTENPLRGFQVR